MISQTFQTVHFVQLERFMTVSEAFLFLKWSQTVENARSRSCYRNESENFLFKNFYKIIKSIHVNQLIKDFSKLFFNFFKTDPKIQKPFILKFNQRLQKLS